MRFQFWPIRLLLIVAVYAVAFGAFSYLGIVGIVIAAVIGTAGSVMVLAIRDKKAVFSSGIVAVGSLVGAFFANLFGVPAIINRYTITDCVRDCIVMAIGALLGGLLFSWASKR